MIMVSHAVLALALTVQPPVKALDLKADQDTRRRIVSLGSFRSDTGWHRLRLSDDTFAKTAARAQPVQKRSRLNIWLPLVGAAVGGTLMYGSVADEEDLVPSGKVMWVGIGAAAGAGVGWVIARIADR